uniref:Coiled-coil domain-containing protein 86 n=1 Tax=Jaculus jaculus TaxID=51337 RepID=A0A8C5KN49_JACJA
MDTPLRRSRRLEGLNPESTGNLPEVPRARRALVEFDSDPEERSEPRSPPSARQHGLGSPRTEPERSPGSPGLKQVAGSGSPQRQPETDPGSPQPQQDAGLESPARLPELRSEPLHRAESPRDSQHHLQPGPGSPEPCPGQLAPGPEPSQPPRELTPHAPGSLERQQEPSQPPPAGETVTGGLGINKRSGSSPRAPASKKLKEREALPEIPKGKPKSGRVWKDRSKKRFSQMVQDKPLRTSWQQKMKEKQEKKLAKDFARHLEEEKARQRQEKKERRAENLRRRLENERKAEIVQVIRNPAKLKRAKKKQLRSIQKRDTLALLQKQPPQRPAAKV